MTGGQGPAPEPMGRPPDGPGGPSGVPGEPGNGAGEQPAGPGVPDIGASAPVPPWRRGRVLLIAGVVAVLLAVLGVIVQRAATGQAGSHAPPGTITFPGTLLGIRLNASRTRAVDRAFRQRAASQGHGKVRGLAAGVYGSPPRTGFLVIGGRVCGTCAFTSFNDAIGHLGLSGVQVIGFDPGPKGGSLDCATASALSAPSGAFECWWYDTTSGAAVAYSPGMASSQAGAAELTRQIRAAVEQ